MKVRDIKELNNFTDVQLTAVWDCLSEINALKRMRYDLDDDQIEEQMGDYLDSVYDNYKGYYTEDKPILTPDEFDRIYTVMVNQPGPLVFTNTQRI